MIAAPGRWVFGATRNSGAGRIPGFYDSPAKFYCICFFSDSDHAPNRAPNHPKFSASEPDSMMRRRALPKLGHEWRVVLFHR